MFFSNTGRRLPTITNIIISIILWRSKCQLFVGKKEYFFAGSNHIDENYLPSEKNKMDLPRKINHPTINNFLTPSNRLKKLKLAFNLKHRENVYTNFPSL